MHQATLEEDYLCRALQYAVRAAEQFFDEKDGGFHFSGAHNERLLVRLKESRDGALPSGNSMMAYNLSRLALRAARRIYSAVPYRGRVLSAGDDAIVVNLGSFDGVSPGDLLAAGNRLPGTLQPASSE